MSYFIGSGVF